MQYWSNIKNLIIMTWLIKTNSYHSLLFCLEFMNWHLILVPKIYKTSLPISNMLLTCTRHWSFMFPTSLDDHIRSLIDCHQHYLWCKPFVFKNCVQSNCFFLSRFTFYLFITNLYTKTFKDYNVYIFLVCLDFVLTALNIAV
jgi:hypothetical protein